MEWLSLAVLACTLASTIWLLVDLSSGSGSANSVLEATPRSGTRGPDSQANHTYANDGQPNLDDGSDDDDDDDALILCKPCWVSRRRMPPRTGCNDRPWQR